jgi:hypothetical protein
MKRKNLIRIVIALTVVLVLLCGTAVALMFRQTTLVTNAFETAIVDCQVHEQTDTGSVMASAKSSITVENTGNIPAYIRVHFVSYWVDDAGNIVGKASEMPSIPYDENTWFKQNGIYYCRAPIAVGGFTPELLQSGKTIILRTDPETGYRQVLEVFADAIQSEPHKAVTNSWKVDISGDNIAPKT